jgi:hypothetical protein
MELFFAVFLLEAIDAASGVHDLLLAGEERVTAGAYFHGEIFSQRGAGIEAVATAACYLDVTIFRMYFGFHGSVPESVWASISWPVGRA